MAVPPELESPHRLPARTTPTWEMELLISGATIFGLLQLPSLLDQAYFDAFNRSSMDLARLLMPLWLYSKFVLFTMIGTFLLHLALRGYWIALVGLDSVYPGGVRWSRMRMGPIGRRVAEQAHPGISDSIEAADNRATRVFGLGFGLALIMMVPVTLVLMALTLTLAGKVLFGVSLDAMNTLSVGVGLVLLPWMLVSLLDRRLGDRIERHPRAAGLLAAVLRFYGRIGIGRSNNLLLALFSSHEGRWRSGRIMLLAILPVTGLVIGQLMVASGEWEFGAYRSLPRATSDSGAYLDPDLYDESRQVAGPNLPLPHIRSRVLDGPYLELFLPFIPRRQLPAMARACPAALQSAEGGQQAIDCLARLSDPRLDGVPVAADHFASTDPRSGLRGVLLMIPASGLGPGRHELSVADVRADGERYRIPFWK